MIGRALHLARRVREAHRNGFRLTPMTVFNTIRLSVRATGRPWYELPVVISGPTLVRVSRLATIEVDRNSRLVIGSGGTRQIFDADRTRAALVIAPKARVRVRGGQVRLSWGTKVRLSPSARLELGGGSFLNAGCLVFVATSVTLGERCNVAWGVTIMDTDFHVVDADRARMAPVAIGDDVWLGADVLILQGSSIGSGTVIGARSVVRGSIPERSLAVGQPAKVVRSNVDWQI